MSVAHTTPDSGSANGNGDEILTAEQVAAWLQLPTSWIYRQAREGHLPALKLGRYVRFRRGSVEAWARSRES